MGWKHQCRLPQGFRIWLRRAKPGAVWGCNCGTWWRLARNPLSPGNSNWAWDLVQDAPDQEPQPEGAYADTERAHRDPSQWDGGYQERPDVQLGFQMEPR